MSLLRDTDREKNQPTHNTRILFVSPPSLFSLGPWCDLLTLSTLLLLLCPVCSGCTDSTTTNRRRAIIVRKATLAAARGFPIPAPCSARSGCSLARSVSLLHSKFSDSSACVVRQPQTVRQLPHVVRSLVGHPLRMPLSWCTTREAGLFSKFLGRPCNASRRAGVMRVGT